MRKTTIYLDEADDLLLTQAAARRGSSRTDLIREAIRRMLSAEAAPGRRPRPLGRSGHTDTSQRVDEILGEGFGR
jgi:Arc/MetJ-type ribon-helix-helix transcriptional regulator